MNKPPSNVHEFLERYAANHHIEGVPRGESNMPLSHVPCPFCAAPDFVTYILIDVFNVLKEGATCRECGRSAKFVRDDETEPGPYFRLMQSGGPDVPPWMDPKIERLS